MNKPLIDKLNDAIEFAAENADTTDDSVLKLIRAASEVVGALKIYEELNLKHIIYDMSRLAGMAGNYPPDFDKKATE